MPNLKIDKITTKIHDGIEKSGCKKWERIDVDKIEDYETSMFTCKKCRKRRIPYLVHVKEGELGYYECYKCGKDVYIRKYCFSCDRK
jgi:hypothetical protein